MEIALWCWVSWYMDIVSVPLYFMGRSNGKLRSTSAELHTGFMPWTIRQISDDLSFWNSDCWIYDFFRTQVDVSQLGFIKAQTGRLFLTHYGWSWTNSETVIPKQVTLQASRIEVASLCNLHLSIQPDIHLVLTLFIQQLMRNGFSVKLIVCCFAQQKKHRVFSDLAIASKECCKISFLPTKRQDAIQVANHSFPKGLNQQTNGHAAWHSAIKLVGSTSRF